MPLKRRPTKNKAGSLPLNLLHSEAFQSTLLQKVVALYSSFINCQTIFFNYTKWQAT